MFNHQKLLEQIQELKGYEAERPAKIEALKKELTQLKKDLAEAVEREKVS